MKLDDGIIKLDYRIIKLDDGIIKLYDEMVKLDDDGIIKLDDGYAYLLLPARLWIRINFLRIRIQLFLLNVDPDPAAF